VVSSRDSWGSRGRDQSIQDTRILDNTLPLAAFDYFEYLQKRKPQPVGPYARECFMEFVSAFVNTRQTAVVLPHGKRVKADPFTTLWHTQAEHASDARPSRLQPGHNEILTANFLESAVQQPGNWARLMRLRWDLYLIQSFKRRAPEWSQEFAQALDLLRPQLEREPTKYASLMSSMESELAPLSAMDHHDSEYSHEARKQKVSIHVYALADALSWFLRGASYRQHAQNRAAKLHPLRLSAIDSGALSLGTLSGREEAPWSQVLENTLRDGKLPSDEGLFTEFLYQLRELTLSAEFQQGLEEYGKRPRAEQLYLKNLMLTAASKAGMALKLRDDSDRRAILEAFENAVNALPVGKMVTRFACQIFRVFPSRYAHLVEVEVRRKLGLDLWRTFEIDRSE